MHNSPAECDAYTQRYEQLTGSFFKKGDIIDEKTLETYMYQSSTGTSGNVPVSSKNKPLKGSCNQDLSLLPPLKDRNESNTMKRKRSLTKNDKEPEKKDKVKPTPKISKTVSIHSLKITC